MQGEPGGAFVRNESYKPIHAVSKALTRPWQLLVMSGVLLAPALVPVCSLPWGGGTLESDPTGWRSQRLSLQALPK